LESETKTRKAKSYRNVKEKKKVKKAELKRKAGYARETRHLLM